MRRLCRGVRKVVADVVAYLPKGKGLPEDVWRLRHRTLSNLLRAHVVIIAVLALATGGVVDAFLFGSVVAVFAALAMGNAGRRRSFSSAMCALGLVTSSAVLVHLSGGTIEMHFHFFVMVGVLTLYQDWLPFLIAIGMVVGHHTVIGVIAPEDVYNHPSAIAHPFRWALIHGGFVLAASVASVVAWRLNEQHALTDALTGLPNRRLFKDRVGVGLARSRRRGALAVLFVDLDGFKDVNDSFGHAAGDELLVTVGERLATCLRSGDTAARLGGDEFAVLADELDGQTGAVVLAERILARLSEPSVMHGKVLTVRASIGIALGAPGMSTEEILRNADVAMYTAKAAGRGRCQMYEDAMHAAVVRRMELDHDLERAVDEGQLVLHYQPVVVLATGRMSGLEALVRWNHPTLGVLAPDDFLPQAEASGAIVPIGGWVLDEACRQAAEWQQRYPGYPLTMAVNLSPRQLLEPDAVDTVRAAFGRSGLAPGDLLLELTEGVMVRDTAVVLERLHDLMALGVGLAIDDFGTGYSSLSYLRTLPFDVLKIDKQFTAGIGRGPSDSAFALAIIELARTLGLETVAEGVERPDQVAELVALGCGMAQGYHFAKPLTAEAVDALLAATAREGWISVPRPARAGRPAVWSASHPSSPE
jgi:diguanylate cyclase (GGDEF)-like protein